MAAMHARFHLDEGILSNYNTAFGTKVEALRELQEKAIGCLLDGKDCVCSLPTGYGKSMIYEILPFADPGCLVIVIAPINSIILQQLTKLGSMAVSLIELKHMSELKSKSYVYTHPEQILENRQFIDTFTTDEDLKLRKLYLVVDEAHCIIQWGDMFRKQYRHIGDLRSVLNCQVLALSATVTEPGQKTIISNLLMLKYNIICASPAKENIELIVTTRPSPSKKGNTAKTPYDFIFNHVLAELKSNPETFPHTIIYCSSKQWIGYGYEKALQHLGEIFYAGDERPQNARVVQFHTHMEKMASSELKDMILSDLQSSNGCIRLIFASVALGMGADLQCIKRIIHAGPPSTLETYVQEIGRAGRAGTSAQAILYYNNTDLGVQHMRKEMKDYCRGDKCYRELINEYFGFTAVQKPSPCCNRCQSELGLEWEFDNMSITQ